MSPSARWHPPSWGKIFLICINALYGLVLEYHTPFIKVPLFLSWIFPCLPHIHTGWTSPVSSCLHHWGPYPPTVAVPVGITPTLIVFFLWSL